jgi:hypothetical protein
MSIHLKYLLNVLYQHFCCSDRGVLCSDEFDIPRQFNQECFPIHKNTSAAIVIILFHSTLFSLARQQELVQIFPLQ